jgi:nucleoside-diphosphate-sugar epimerase
VVAHFAARVGAAACAGDPVGAVRSNVVATRRVAEACAAAGARLAYASTADVTAATSLYARTKLWGEQLARVFDPEGLQLLRISNPYGPGHGAVARFVERAEERQPIRAYRGETRSGCWVGDAARAIALLLDAPPAVYDVGRDDEPVTMSEAARVACDVAGAPRELVEEVDAPNDRVSVPVSAETLRALGWQPRVSLEEGLRLLVRAPR